MSKKTNITIAFRANIRILHLAQRFDLNFESPSDKEFSLFRLGERVYDHLLILPAKSGGLRPVITTESLIDFLDSKGNIIVVLSADYEIPLSLNSFLSELGIYLPTDRRSIVVDHFNHDLQSSPGHHDTLLVSTSTAVKSYLKGYSGGDKIIAMPRAVGQILDSSSPLTMSFLQASASAYSYNAREEFDIVEEPFGTGRQLSLVSAMQARNSARVAVIGSSSMIEDSWFDAKVKSRDSNAKRTGNFELISKVFGWTYKKFGVLKSGGIEHVLEGAQDEFPRHDSRDVQKIKPHIYRIKNHLVCLLY